MSHDLPATRWAHACVLSIEKALGREFSGPDAAKVQGALLNPPWVSVTDRMPSETEHARVLIYTDGVDFAGEQFFDVATDSLNEWRYESPADQPEVCRAATHWLPLPPPPQEQA